MAEPVDTSMYEPKEEKKWPVEEPRPIRPMDATEFEVIRLQLGEEGEPYPMTWLARALGYSTPRSLYKWINDDYSEEVPLCAAKLMRKWLAQGFVD